MRSISCIVLRKVFIGYLKFHKAWVSCEVTLNIITTMLLSRVTSSNLRPFSWTIRQQCCLMLGSDLLFILCSGFAKYIAVLG